MILLLAGAAHLLLPSLSNPPELVTLSNGSFLVKVAQGSGRVVEYGPLAESRANRRVRLDQAVFVRTYKYDVHIESTPFAAQAVKEKDAIIVNATLKAPVACTVKRTIQLASGTNRLQIKDQVVFEKPGPSQVVHGAAIRTADQPSAFSCRAAGASFDVDRVQTALKSRDRFKLAFRRGGVDVIPSTAKDWTGCGVYFGANVSEFSAQFAGYQVVSIPEKQAFLASSPNPTRHEIRTGLSREPMLYHYGAVQEVGPRQVVSLTTRYELRD